MRRLFGLLLTSFVTCNVVQADYALRWSPTTGTSTGAPITVDLFLDETSPDTNLSNFGVVRASYKVSLNGVGTLDLPIENPNFDDSNPPTTTGTAATVEQASILGLPDISGSLKIGTSSVNSTMTGTGNLTLSLFGSGADFAVYNGMFVSQVLDGLVVPAQPFNFSFTAVPEPGSIGTAASLAWEYGIDDDEASRVRPIDGNDGGDVINRERLLLWARISLRTRCDSLHRKCSTCAPRRGNLAISNQLEYARSQRKTSFSCMTSSIWRNRLTSAVSFLYIYPSAYQSRRRLSNASND